MKILQTAADTLSQKPEIGIFGSMAGVALSPIQIISLISAALGLIVTVLTLILNIQKMYEKIQNRKHGRHVGDEEVIIDNKRYRRIEDEDEAE